MVIVAYREKSRGNIEEDVDSYRWSALSRKVYSEFRGHHTNQAYYKSGCQPYPGATSV